MRDAINQMAVLVVWLWKDVCIVNGEIPVGAVAAAMSDGWHAKKQQKKKQQLHNTYMCTKHI